MSMSSKLNRPLKAGAIFLKWLLYSIFIGMIVGAVAVAFHYGIDLATELRGEYPRVIWLLPLGGVAIILLYRVCGMEKDRGTNLVLVAVRDAEPMKLRTAPLIFLSTILTHLVGGSAGREGAALQLGSSISNYIGKKIHLSAKDHRVMIMCGMSAAFSALFGTPMTAAIFALEVVSVGRMYYGCLVPSLVSALTGYQVARFFGLHFGSGYLISLIPRLTSISMLQVSALGILCALLSILFCEAMHIAPKIYAKSFPNPVVRAAVGGALVLFLTLLVGDQSFNGAGDPLIRRLLTGESIPCAFLLKILFTALTLGAGFRGGEIVPTLCTGAAFGATIAPFMGLSPSFAGSVGMAAVFCGATNCPISAIFLSYELFGGGGLPLYALACGVSYMLSGYYGLYSEQKIVSSKIAAEPVDRKAE